MNESIKRSIEAQLSKLEAEERQLNSFYERKMRVANDSYYVEFARSKANRDAMYAQKRLDEIISNKIELTQELRQV